MASKLMLVAWMATALISIQFSCGAQLFTPSDVQQVLDNSVFKPNAWTEGPMFDRKGNFYITAPLVTDGGQTGGDIYSVDLEHKQLKSVAQPIIKSVGGNQNGGQCDQDGNLWVTDLRHALLKVAPTGKFTQIARHDSNNQTLQGFNDGTFDFTGNMWITAPAGEIAPAEYEDGVPPNKRVNGSLYCYSRANDTMIKLDSGYFFCNGIAVQHSKDGVPLHVIVAETFTRKLWAYDISGPCSVRNKRLWGTSPDSVGYWGGFDGMKFDSAGNLLVTNFGKHAIEVFKPQGGTPFMSIRLPVQNITNIVFKPNSNEVMVTASPATLWSFKWKYKGHTEYYQLTTNGSTVIMGPVVKALLLVALLFGL